MDESAKLYMTHAEKDLIVAETLSGDSEAHTGARAFHSQQAAEKAIRAALVVWRGAKEDTRFDISCAVSPGRVGHRRN